MKATIKTIAFPLTIICVNLWFIQPNLADENNSIVDWLKSRGQDSSYTAREKIFKSEFGGNFVGSAEQNIRMHALLREREGACNIDLQANILNFGGVWACPSKFSFGHRELTEPFNVAIADRNDCAHHAFLLTTDLSGNRHFFRAGPTNRKLFNWGAIKVEHGKYGGGTIDFREPPHQRVHLGVVNDPNCSNTIAALTEHARQVNEASIGYKPFGPNCNSYLHDAVIRNTDFSMPKLEFNAPGINQTLHGHGLMNSR
ncbi:MAG: hypothetical protein AAF939_10735 [Planctomycetota bacterium]